MKISHILIASGLCFTISAVSQVFQISSFGSTMPAIQKAVESERSFSLPRDLARQ